MSKIKYILITGLNKFIGFLVDLLWRPEPSCKEKPLDRGVMIGVIVGLLGIGFLIWVLTSSGM